MNSINSGTPIDISSLTLGKPEVQGGQQASHANQESSLDQKMFQSEPNHPKIEPFNNVQVVQTSRESSAKQTSVLSQLTPTIPIEKVEFTKTRRDPKTTIVTERTVLAAESRPERRRDFDISDEKQHTLDHIDWKWVKAPGFGQKVENLEYRVYLDNAIVETKLKAQLEAAEAQQKDQTPGRFTDPGNRKFNAEFASQGSSKGEVGLDKRNIFDRSKSASEECMVTSKYETEGCNTGVAWSLGRRDGMEDSHIASTFEVKVGNDQFPVQLTGVFDGHGGPTFSAYVKANIVKTLKHYLEAFNQGGLSDAGIMSALKIAMVALDGQKDAPSPVPYEDDGGDSRTAYPGTTANVSITIKDELWIANVGDSRALLVDTGGNTRQLSKDIKPVDVKVKVKVEDRGGMVLWKKIMGMLAVGTAIGDHNCASVSSRPKVTRLTADQFKGQTLIQVCDGITDVASSNQIGQVASEYLLDGDSPARVAGKLVAQAYAALSTDNLTCMVTPLP